MNGLTDVELSVCLPQSSRQLALLDQCVRQRREAFLRDRAESRQAGLRMPDVLAICQRSKSATTQAANARTERRNEFERGAADVPLVVAVVLDVLHRQQRRVVGEFARGGERDDGVHARAVDVLPVAEPVQDVVARQAARQRDPHHVRGVGQCGFLRNRRVVEFRARGEVTAITS